MEITFLFIVVNSNLVKTYDKINFTEYIHKYDPAKHLAWNDE